MASTNLSTKTYRNVRDLPAAVWRALESNARNANVILPQTIKARAESSAGRPTTGIIWITCSSSKSSSSNIEYVLAVTEGITGSYPIFIYTTLPFHLLRRERIRPSIKLLAMALDSALSSRRRVYSVFAPKSITEVFAQEWSDLTCIAYYNKPYYAASISYCTARTLDTQSLTKETSLGYKLRPAVADDVQKVGELCFLFAKDSPPFVLSRGKAQMEARRLIEMKQVWVHEAQHPGQQKEIACIVAFTRNSDKVAAITKVCTNPEWRRRGCAGRLVREVCKYLLITGPNPKESVVLYAAHDNLAARSVYDRIGFVGLSQGGPTVEGADPWLEIGLDASKVDIGHW
ncbi:hypothetical protein DXG03_004037 [Asterophora parasitica]|uniref:N-acetyltransferase domain-containing protein n=1 Tax=Asterophora parasitica TaxID=117018 RepID=A0A9P7KBW3_9AGAR|nr:hypothetical protein DXG03_004037 [Asterophora parasitica]